VIRIESSEEEESTLGLGSDYTSLVTCPLQGEIMEDELMQVEVNEDSNSGDSQATVSYSCQGLSPPKDQPIKEPCKCEVCTLWNNGFFKSVLEMEDRECVERKRDMSSAKQCVKELCVEREDGNETIELESEITIVEIEEVEIEEARGNEDEASQDGKELSEEGKDSSEKEQMESESEMITIEVEEVVIDENGNDRSSADENDRERCQADTQQDTRYYDDEMRRMYGAEDRMSDTGETSRDMGGENDYQNEWLTTERNNTMPEQFELREFPDNVVIGTNTRVFVFMAGALWPTRVLIGDRLL
jgi:hypothetical protein